MNYLAIDTSGKHITVVIKYEDKIYKYFDSDCGVHHSVVLMPTIEKLVEENKVDLEKMDFFSAVIGAGSFTGIRIAVSTIKGMCLAYNKPCLPITSFDTIAYNVKKGKVLAVIDAGHNGYYVCGYSDKTEDYKPSYIMGEELSLLQKEYKLYSGEKVAGFKTKRVSILDGLISAIESLSEKNITDAENLNPLYVRKSQAEEGR